MNASFLPTYQPTYLPTYLIHGVEFVVMFIEDTGFYLNLRPLVKCSHDAGRKYTVEIIVLCILSLYYTFTRPIFRFISMYILRA